jgi:transposase InsO family protein
VKYALIRRNRRLWPIRVQCQVLGVSVAGYHEHMARRLTIALRRHLSDEALLVHIRAVFAAHRGAYGWPRIWRQLRAEGVRVGKLRVQQLMQQHGIRARGKRRFRVTTDSRHGLPIAPNLLNRNFTVPAPNRVWAGDMTYIQTEEGWLFLAVVLDLFSRRIVGWAMGDAITAELACRALDMARYSRLPAGGLIFHSDRGSQYASRRYTDLLAGHGINASMSRKGNCWDNACSESLFGSLKVERLHGMDFQNHREAKDATLDWLLWYNGSRMHSTLRYLSPAQFEQQAINLRPALAA